MDILLSRDTFRLTVFERDNNKCVVCFSPAQDAHHILERRLWPDGGYYLSNGASLCGEHHIAAEKTLLTVEHLRELCGIAKPVLPPHLYSDQIYDKWGNVILSDGRRLKGELYGDESVQKILQGIEFTSLVKYPRTYHLPWSNPGKDDRTMDSLAQFENRMVVVTEKMDGENTSMYNGAIHARSVDGLNHPSRAWVKNFWAGISADIPEGWRVCGENLFAKHSIGYEDLPSYFLGFSIWNESNVCLSWEHTVEWFAMLGIEPVPLVYHGLFDREWLISYSKKLPRSIEGYVLRDAESFTYRDFRSKVAKYVRPQHVQTSEHWRFGQPIIRNLIGGA